MTSDQRGTGQRGDINVDGEMTCRLQQWRTRKDKLMEFVALGEKGRKGRRKRERKRAV